MALPATDSFTAANGSSLSANWTVQAGSLVIQGNACAASSVANQENDAVWNADAFASNSHYSKVTVANAGLNTYWGATVAAQGSGGTLNYYGARKNANTSTTADFELFKVVNGTFTLLQTGNSNDGYTSSGSSIYLQVVGGVLTAQYLNSSGVVISTSMPPISDSSITGGAAGIFLYGGTVTYNNAIDTWVGDNVVPVTYDPITACFPIGYYE